MSIDLVIGLLQAIEKSLEDMWIDREILCQHLRQYGYTVETLKSILGEAQLDPDLRKRSRAAFAEMRENLEKAAREAAYDAVSELPPPKGEAN